MNKLISLATAALFAAATAGHAGGVDRSGQSISALFEAGNYLEISFGSVNPTVSGTQALVFPPSVTGSSSGDMTSGYGFPGFVLKLAISEKVDVAFVYDEPFGASVSYPFPTTYFATGSSAVLESDAFTGIVKYKFTDKFSIYGGIREQLLNARATIPFIPGGGYVGTAPNASGLGYLVGVAYERPDIAMRIALTYNSSIKHDLKTTETSVLGAGRTSTTEVNAPQSINLDFQTGIAPKTLLFGGVRWVQWSEFTIAPADYTMIVGSPLVSFADDTFTYSLGVGRQLNENWSVAVSATHEPSTGGLKSNLAPTDGRSAVGLGVTYRQDGFKLQAGLQHIWIGDATTSVFGTPGGVFTDNTAVAFGFKAGFSF